LTRASRGYQQPNDTTRERVMSDQPTRPSAQTRAAERDEARKEAGADRAPAPEEDRFAETHEVDRNAAEYEREINERGADQQGEGKLP